MILSSRERAHMENTNNDVVSKSARGKDGREREKERERQKKKR